MFYALIPPKLVKKSRCPKCEQVVHLLQADDLDSPAFYICFPCQQVFMVGCGPVPELVAE